MTKLIIAFVMGLILEIFMLVIIFDDLREEMLKLRKENLRLKDDLKKAHLSNGTLSAKLPITGGFNPREDTTKLSDGGKRQIRVILKAPPGSARL